MKKLIINEKNLPKIGKMSDSNIRIRINKAQCPHEPLPLKKSVSVQLQQIDTCLQTLEKFLNKSGGFEEQKAHITMQLLKNYKEVLNPNQQLMTQSLKFSKLKFKTMIETENKENSSSPPKTEKQGKEAIVSDRVPRLAQKSSNAVKQQKGRKFLSMHKKNTEESLKQEQAQKNESIFQELNKEEDQLVESRFEQKPLENMALSIHEDPNEQQEQCDNQMPKYKVREFESEVEELKRALQQKHQEISEKSEQVKQLNERIEQLNVNIQNLVKKNSQKSQQFNKLFQETVQIKEKFAKTYELQEQVEQLKRKCTQLQQQKQEIERRKNMVQKQMRHIEQEKNQRIQQELGRYETAQQFYELTRSDLQQQNQNLMHLLQERQRQLTNLYQVIRTVQSQTLQAQNTVLAM